MPSTAHAASSGPDPISIEVFERLVALSAKALDALEATDVEELGRVMLERERIIGHATPVNGGELPFSMGVQEASRLRSAAERLRDADARLTLALASKRDEITRDLEALEHGHAARSAYGGRSKGRGQIDLVR